MTKKTRVESDGLGDWRIQAASRLVDDLPAAYPGGPSHKAGASVLLSTSASTTAHSNFNFITPSAAALALSASFRSAVDAGECWSKVEIRDVPTPSGSGHGVDIASLSMLFEFFSASMSAVGSAFQAIEAFANHEIARRLAGTMTLERRRGPETLDAEQIERWVSTEEKVAIVLPRLLNIPSLKGSNEWKNFRLLMRARDGAIHFKSGDQYPLSGKIEKDALYTILLDTDPAAFPSTSLRLISYYCEPTKPRWVIHLLEKYGADGPGYEAAILK